LLSSDDQTDVRLRLARAAALDIKSLVANAEVADVFGKFLQETVKEFSRYLKIGGRNPVKLLGIFSEFRVTLNPQTSWHYDTNGNAFVINLLCLLYRPAWLLAAAFVHEAEHVLFLRRKGMLNAPEPEQDLFAKRFTREMEILATKEEQKFLLDIKRHIPPRTRIAVTIRRCFDYRIDDYITRTVKTLRGLEASRNNRAKSYIDSSEERALREHPKVASVLRIELPSANSEGKYEELKIVFKAE